MTYSSCYTPCNSGCSSKSNSHYMCAEPRATSNASDYMQTRRNDLAPYNH